MDGLVGGWYVVDGWWVGVRWASGWAGGRVS